MERSTRSFSPPELCVLGAGRSYDGDRTAHFRGAVAVYLSPRGPGEVQDGAFLWGRPFCAGVHGRKVVSRREGRALPLPEGLRERS